jgi:hypothetical protein
MPEADLGVGRNTRDREVTTFRLTSPNGASINQELAVGIALVRQPDPAFFLNRVQANRVLRRLRFECPTRSRRTQEAKASTRYGSDYHRLCDCHDSSLMPYSLYRQFPIQQFNQLDFRKARDAIAGAPRFFDAPMTALPPILSRMPRERQISCLGAAASSCSIAGLFLVCDRRLRTFVEPSPIDSVAFPLTFVGLAALGRTKLLEAPAESD